MSMCDRCIHGEVCGLEDNHEGALIYCKNMIPIDVFDKIREEIMSLTDGDIPVRIWNDDVLKIIDRYKAESEGGTQHDRAE